MRGKTRKKKATITVIGSLKRPPDFVMPDVWAGALAGTAGNVLLSEPDSVPANVLAASLLTEQGIRIVHVHGTNGKVEIEDIDAAEKLIACCDMMLLLLNVEVGVIVHAAELAKKYHIKVVLDPVPMMALPEKIRRTAGLIGRPLTRARKRHPGVRKRTGIN